MYSRNQLTQKFQKLGKLAKPTVNLVFKLALPIYVTAKKTAKLACDLSQ